MKFKIRYQGFGQVGNLYRWVWQARLAGWWYYYRRGEWCAAKVAFNNVEEIRIFEA